MPPRNYGSGSGGRSFGGGVGPRDYSGAGGSHPASTTSSGSSGGGGGGFSLGGLLHDIGTFHLLPVHAPIIHFGDVSKTPAVVVPKITGAVESRLFGKRVGTAITRPQQVLG